MRKFFLFFSLLLCAITTMAQTEQVPVVTVVSPFAANKNPIAYLTEEDEAKVFALSSITIAIDLRTASSAPSGRDALICASDISQATSTSGVQTNSPYIAYGLNGAKIAYLASSASGDMFTDASKKNFSVAANTDYKIVYVIDLENSKFSAYVDGVLQDEATYPIIDYALQSFSNFANNSNANIYIGGGRTSSGNIDVFDGTIYSVQFYEGAMSATDVADIEYPARSPYYRIAYDGYTDAVVRYAQSKDYKSKSGTENNVTTYALTMEDNTDASSVFCHYNGQLLSYDKGVYVKDVSNARGLQPVGVAGGALTLSPSTRSKGKVNIQLTSYMHANSDNNGYFIDHCGNDGNHTAHDLILEPVTALPVTLTAVGSAAWGTLHAPVALEVPAGVEAFYISGFNGDVATMTKVETIPANTAVILTSTEAGTYDFKIVADVAAIEGNKLEGTVAKETKTMDAYILSAGSDGSTIGLYPLSTNGTESNSFINGSHKAYLPATNIPTASQGSTGFGFRFEDGYTTVIESVEAENEAENIVYDLTGRRVEAATAPGIYIVNGKKVLVK